MSLFVRVYTTCRHFKCCRHSVPFSLAASGTPTFARAERAGNEPKHRRAYSRLANSMTLDGQTARAEALCRALLVVWAPNPQAVRSKL